MVPSPHDLPAVPGTTPTPLNQNFQPPTIRNESTSYPNPDPTSLPVLQAPIESSQVMPVPVPILGSGAQTVPQQAALPVVEPY